MPDRVGQQFGSYLLVRLLGRGGFAEVYLGQHVRLSSQKAALKILSTQLNEEDIQAFEREAETIASLIHPHIVRMLDFDIKEGLPFLVMDYAPNGSLRQRHRSREQVPLPALFSYIQQIAEGLQYAHDQKIIHRDIKPDNMLIGARDEIVVSDFESLLLHTVRLHRVLKLQLAPFLTWPRNRCKSIRAPPAINMLWVLRSMNGW